MLDKEGYRPNVGIILANPRNEVFWGKRVNQHAWQFPQGGIKHGETPLQAMYRELEEEIGLQRSHARMAALRGARKVAAARLQGVVPRAEADLVPAAHGGPRLRRQAARERASRVRRVALARILGVARDGDRLQARRVSPGAV